MSKIKYGTVLHTETVKSGLIKVVADRDNSLYVESTMAHQIGASLTYDEAERLHRAIGTWLSANKTEA